MAISRDPTRTRAIERAWLRDIARRWREFERTVIARLLETPQLVVNAEADPFVMSASQQRTYMAFVEREINRLLLAGAEPPNWQAQYQLQSYERGLQQVRDALMAQGAPITPTAAERLAAEGMTTFSATPTLSTGGIPGGQVHTDALEFLFQRSYTSLKGWTDAMSRQTRQVLFDGVEQGQNPREIARRITERIEVSALRARTIAQTETNQAYSRASLAEIARASEETGEDIETRWITARDSRVRHSHAEVHGVVMTRERAQQIKMTDGINCRCALVPVIPGTDTAKRRARFEQERTVLLLLERK